MKKPVVDYRQFRLSRVNEPQFSHLKLLLGWVVYFILYFVTENLIPLEKCHVVHSALDDVIPFCELFVIPYTLWYVLIVGSLLYFALYDIDSFRRMSIFIMITQAVAMLVYILWPSRQELRPDVMPRQNFFTWIISIIYAFDTPSGVCPSLHVGYSLGIASVWCKYKPASLAWKLFIVAFVAVICISTAFVKQHSVVDIVAALPMGVLAEAIVFRDWYRKKLRAGRE